MKLSISFELTSLQSLGQTAIRREQHRPRMHRVTEKQTNKRVKKGEQKPRKRNAAILKLTYATILEEILKWQNEKGLFRILLNGLLSSFKST